MTIRVGKKRVANVESSTSNTAEETEQVHCDILDSNDKRIVTYNQLESHRKSKHPSVQLELNINKKESYVTFKLKKKNFPLMAKCQRNIKYLKHNRCMPKPRAHVGSGSKETSPVKISIDFQKKTKYQIKPKRVQNIEPNRRLLLNSEAETAKPAVVNKSNKEKEDIKTQESVKAKKRKNSTTLELCVPKPRAHVGSGSKETRPEKIYMDFQKKLKYPIKPKRVQNIEPNWHSFLNSEAEKAKPAVLNKSKKEQEEIKTQESVKAKKRKHSKTMELFSDNTVPDRGNESSEESDCFEKFIKEQTASKKENRLERNVKRKKKSKLNVFKRIKNIKYLSPWSHSDDEDSCGNSSKTALNKSSITNTLPESREKNDISNSNDESNDNSFQFDFENVCDDSSDICEPNEDLDRPNVLSSNSSIVCQETNTVKLSIFDILKENDALCSSSFNVANVSNETIANQIFNQAMESLPVPSSLISSVTEESYIQSPSSKKEEVRGYENDDWLILNNYPPELTIKISSVMSVPLLPETDEVENSESAHNLSNNKLIDTNISQEMDGVTNKILFNDLESVCQTDVLSHQAVSNFETQPKTSLMNGLEQLKPLKEELDDCIILDDDPQSVSNICNINRSHNCSNSVRSYHLERVDVNPSVKSSLDNTDQIISTKEFDQEQTSVASSRFGPNSPTLSNTNIWEVLRTINFEKLKVFPQSLSAQTSNNVLERKEVMDASSNAINLSSHSQLLEKSIACPVSSSMCKNSEDVEVIDLSDEENDRTGSSEFHNTQFTSQVTASNLDSLNNKQHRSKSWEIIDHLVPPRVSNSKLYIQDKSLKSGAFADGLQLPICKQEVSSAELCGVRKEELSTSDEIDLILATSLQTVGNSKEKYIQNRLDLYNTEYQEFLNIRNTLRNLSDGLNFLLNKQVHKLMHIGFPIKNIPDSPCLLGDSKEKYNKKLLDLYNTEYQQFLNIRNTLKNVSAGLNLLLKKQVARLMHIRSSIKNIVKHDPCFLKMSKTLKTDMKPIKDDAIVKKEEDCKMEPTQSSENAHAPDTVCSELSMYTDSVLQGVQQLVGNSLPPESSSLRAEKVKEQLRNIKCVQCGETATAACKGCSKVFYCSTECGMSDWEKGHSVSCGI